MFFSSIKIYRNFNFLTVKVIKTILKVDIDRNFGDEIIKTLWEFPKRTKLYT